MAGTNSKPMFKERIEALRIQCDELEAEADRAEAAGNHREAQRLTIASYRVSNEIDSLYAERNAPLMHLIATEKKLAGL